MADTAMLSDNEMLLALAEAKHCSEIAVVAGLLAFHKKDASQAFIIHHYFVLGGRTTLLGIQEFFRQENCACSS